MLQSISSDGHGWPLLLLLQAQDREQDRAIRGGETDNISRYLIVINK